MRLFAAAALLFALVVPSLARAEDPTVTLQCINEGRYLQVNPKYMSTGHSTSMNFVLLLNNIDPNPTAYGNFVFHEAKDDLGTNLLAKMNEMPAQQMQDLNIIPPVKALEVRFFIPQAPRKATKITSLKGEFTLVSGGEKKQVLIPAIKTLIGKAVDNADLKAAGVTMTVKASDLASYKDQAVILVVKGNREAIKTLKLVDKDGKETLGPCSGSRDYKPATQTEECFLWVQKLDDTAQAKIDFVVNQKKVVIPFAFKDQPLP